MGDKQMGIISMGGGDASSIGQGPAQPIPATHASNTALLEHTKRYVEQFWFEAGEDERNDKNRTFSPMVIAVCANGDIVPIMAAMAFDEDEKEEFALTMRKLFQVWNVQRYAFISEAWVAVYEGKDPRDKDGSLPESLRPVNREDRKEVMTINIAGKNEENEFDALEMVRDWNTGLVTGLISFETSFGDKSGIKMTGRFMKLLEPPPFEGNPAHNPENQTQIEMLSVILEAPEFMRERYEKFGQDFEGVRAKGTAIKKRLKIAYDDLSKAPEPEWEGLCAALNVVLDEARVYAQQMLSDIDERRAGERATH